MGSYLDSQIGYATKTLTAPVTAYPVAGKAAAVSGAVASVGASGMAVAGKAAASSDAYASVVSSADLYAPSAIGYATATLTAPVVAFSVAGKADADSDSFGSIGAGLSVAGKAAASSSAFASVAVPPPGSAYGPSAIGYATKTLGAPAQSLPVGGMANVVSSAFALLAGAVIAPSQIGYATATLTAPGGPASPYGASLIGYVTGSLNAPHKPILAVMPDGSLQRARIRTWDGTKLV